MDAEQIAAEAVAEAESDTVPAEDPQPAGQISFTPVSLFVTNLIEVHRALKAVQSNSTAKLQNDQFLVTEAAKYAHALLGIQLGMMRVGQ